MSAKSSCVLPVDSLQLMSPGISQWMTHSTNPYVSFLRAILFRHSMDGLLFLTLAFPNCPQVISFFEKPAKFVKHVSSDDGEVPDQFRVSSIELSVECSALPQLQRFGKSRFHASFLLSESPDGAFKHEESTEHIFCNTHPSFVRRCFLEPLSQPNSQAIARASVVRIEVFSWKKPLGFADFRLSDVLWNKFEALPLILHSEEHKPSYDRATTAKVLLKAEPVSRVSEEHATKIAELDCHVSPALVVQIRQNTFFYTVLREAEKGHWIPVFRSQQKTAIPGCVLHFRKQTLRLVDALGGFEHRLLRIQLWAKGRTHPQLIGFSQFRLQALEEAVKSALMLPWSTGRSCSIDVSLRARGTTAMYSAATPCIIAQLDFMCCSECPEKTAEVVSFDVLGTGK